jgi:hypothetical protein
MVALVADLRPVTPGNGMNKFADDTYIAIPTAKIDSRQAELKHVKDWAKASNLEMNGRRPAADRGIHSSQHVLPIRAGGSSIV